MKRWGIALGGGGILGLAHIGILQVMESQGLVPSIVTGTSAGAVVAGLYASGVELLGMEDVTLKALLPDDESVDIDARPVTPLGLSGLIGGDLIESTLDRILRGAYLKDAKMGLAIPSVDIRSGSIIVFTNASPWMRPSQKALDMAGRVYVTDAKVSLAIRASTSVPGVFKPKKLGPWRLVDGGIRDMVPVYECRRMGADEVVAVDLSLHVEKPQDANNAVSILSRSFQLAARETTERSLIDYASITLQPDVLESGLPTPTKCRALIEAGRTCAQKHLPRLTAMVSGCD